MSQSGNERKHLPGTVGELEASGYRSRSVKQEMRENLLGLLESGEPLFPGIHGYEDTVEPGLANAVLSRHDFVLLGLRGQAKTRILRMLTRFLDEWVPFVPGSPLREDPLAPVLPATTRRLAEEGAAARIGWLNRDERYAEKLATPDVTVADLLGDVDPIKASHRGLSLDDEEVITFGIVPRANRGIFAINEIPDLSPRLQVVLLNILEERDVQIRGFPLRLPLDLCLTFSANPEDYTNRGNLITPLRDRIASQILTHYPKTLESAVSITAQEAWTDRGATGPGVDAFLREVVERVAVAARESDLVDQTSGVSARLPIALLEAVVSNMERRAIRAGADSKGPRVADLYRGIPAVCGKLELVYEGEQEGPAAVADHVIGKGILAAFLARFPAPGKDAAEKGPYASVLGFFSEGKEVVLEEMAPAAGHRKRLRSVPGLEELTRKHFQKPSSEEEVSFAMECVLEALFRKGLVARDRMEGKSVYQDAVRTMLKDL